MATAFAKFFKKKTNKENSEPQAFNREKTDRFSLRHHKPSNISNVHSADVYTGEQRYDDAFINRDYSNADRDGAGVHAFNASLASQLPYRSPYDIVTEPKTTKATRSCPGGNRGTRSIPHQRRFSPQSSDQRFRYQQHPPTIHEVSGSYENYPSNSQLAARFEEKDGYVDNSSKSDVGGRVRKNNTGREDKRLRYRNSESHDYRNENDLNDNRFHKPFNSSKGRQMPSGSWSRQNQSGYRANSYHGAGYNYPLPNSTSEYGSADPSPTNQVMQLHRKNQNDFFQDNSFDNTDYDSDSDSVTMFMKQQLKKAKAKCDMYKEKAKAYKKRYANLLLTMNDVKEQLSCEKRDNDMLRTRLTEQEEKLSRMTKILQQQQFHQVSSAHQHPSHAHQHHRNPNFLTDDSSSALHCLTGGGAGEALCSRTELASADPDMLLALASTTQQQKCLNDGAAFVNNSGLFNIQNDEMGVNDDSCAEQPRCANVTTEMSPITTFYNAMTTSFVHSESKQLVSKMDDDGYSTMQQPSEKNEANLIDQLSENEAVSKRRNAEIGFVKTDGGSSTSSVSALSSNTSTDVAENSDSVADNNDTRRMGEESKLNRKDTAKTTTDVVVVTSSQHSRHIRRSFSDSEVSKITSDSYVEGGGEYANKEVVVDLADLEPPTSSTRKVVFCEVSKKHIGAVRGHHRRYASRHGDYSSSYSSDDETARILAKQLTRRGSVVQFRPPRKSVVHNEKQLFKHFGSDERKAIAEFEYLHNIPTDVSGLPSSPELSSRSKQRMNKD